MVVDYKWPMEYLRWGLSGDGSVVMPADWQYSPALLDFKANIRALSGGLIPLVMWFSADHSLFLWIPPP